MAHVTRCPECSDKFTSRHVNVQIRPLKDGYGWLSERNTPTEWEWIKILWDGCVFVSSQKGAQPVQKVPQVGRTTVESCPVELKTNNSVSSSIRSPFGYTSCMRFPGRINPSVSDAECDQSWARMGLPSGCHQIACSSTDPAGPPFKNR